MDVSPPSLAISPLLTKERQTSPDLPLPSTLHISAPQQGTLPLPNKGLSRSTNGCGLTGDSTGTNERTSERSIACERAVACERAIAYRRADDCVRAADSIRTSGRTV